MPSATTNRPISGRSQWLSSLLVRRRPLSVVTAQLNDSNGAGLIVVASALVLQMSDGRRANRTRRAHEPSRDMEPAEGLVQRHARPLVVDIGPPPGEPLFGALARRLGALRID